MVAVAAEARMIRAMNRWFLIWLGFFPLAALAFTGCMTIEFYAQGIAGQTEIVVKSRRNEVVLADAATDTGLRKKLAAVEEIRAFAKNHLTLPGDESYGRYTDLRRKHVTWVLYAAPEFSLKPKTWWYPALGNLDYRGYFKEDATRQLAASLKSEGFDVCMGGVDAYSTLGWLHDPVLNTFVRSADVDLAELIFHELTHRKYFRKGATAFNEAFANVVAEEGVRRWLRHHGRAGDLRKYEARIVRRAEFYDEIDRSRAELEKLYASACPEEEMRRRKKTVFARLQNQFRELRRRWGGRGLEEWLTGELGNAHLVSVATYHHHMPAFRKLLEECNGDLEEFFRRAKQLGID